MIPFRKRYFFSFVLMRPRTTNPFCFGRRSHYRDAKQQYAHSPLRTCFRNFTPSSKVGQQQKSTSSDSPFFFHSWKWTPMPITLGLSWIAIQQYRHIREREEQYLKEFEGDPEARVIGPAYVAFLKTIPFRTISRWWGHINTAYELPVWLRTPIYKLWTFAFGCNLDEMEENDLRSFRNLNEFFTRRLKPDARPIDSEAAIVSPADARVLHFGPVSQKSLEQVKGITYSMDNFLGCGEHSWDPLEKYHDVPYHPTEHQLYHIVLYLAPGDYHRFHSPVSWAIDKLKYFSGKLFSVSPGMVKVLQGIFVQNERIVMLGDWAHGFFSMTAVGATNVGSIQLQFDQSFKTNQRIKEKHGTYIEKCLKTNKVVRLMPSLKSAGVSTSDIIAKPLPMSENNPGYPAGLSIQKGDEMGQFNLGSTIVLVFEAPKDFRFCVNAEDKVKVGQPLGYVHDLSNQLHSHNLQSHEPHRTFEQVVKEGLKERRGFT